MAENLRYKEVVASICRTIGAAIYSPTSPCRLKPRN